MSDTSQGPGWWLASDGKWYPPEFHPDATAQPQGADQPQGPAWWLASDGRWYPPELRPGPGALEHPASAATSEGPGWWLASDGRWYPPELHPDVLSRTAVALAEPQPAEPEPAPLPREAARAVEPEKPPVEEPAPVVEDTGPPTDPVPVVAPESAGEATIEAGEGQIEEETPFSYWQRVRSGTADADAVPPLAEKTGKERRGRWRRKGAVAPPADDPAAPAAGLELEREPEPETLATAAAPVDTELLAPQTETRRARRKQRRRRSSVVVIAAVLVLAGAAAAGVALTRSSGTPSTPSGHRAATSVPTTPSVSAWTAPGVHVVGGPVVAAGHLLVLDTATDGTVALAAIDPRTGKVQWQQPYSPSAIPPGVLVQPVSSGTVALDLAPAGGATNSAVVVQGIDLATGKPAWSAPVPAVVVDAPVVCTARSLFCVNVSAAGGVSQLEQLDPTKGSVLATVSGPDTQMASGLYQNQAQPPGFVQVADSGMVLWTKAVSALFGGAQYSPQYGYDFVNAGALEIGTVGVASVNGTEALGSLKTVGVAASSGAVVWTVPGALDCFGVIPVAPQFICRYSGSGSYVNGNLSTTGVVLTVEGLDPATGAVPWSVPLSQAQSLTTGNGVPVADADHVVVPLTGGPALLDLTSGKIASLPANAVLWCGQSQQASVQAPSTALSNGQRVGVALFAPCTAQGTPSGGTPASALPAMGVSVDGLFVWPSPGGLMASPVPH